MRRSHWLLLTTACTLACAASPAMAEQSPPQAEASAPGDEAAIIVTARRQNERLQDVPASVAVLTAEALQRTGATKAEDFVRQTRA